MTANVALTDTFGTFKDKANELIIMTQTVGMGNFIKLLDTTQSTSNTTGSIITAGGVGIAKNVTIGGSVNVHGNLHANGNITSDGDLTLGDADTDNVVFGADVNSHIIPNTDDTFDLGSTAQQWRNIYIDGTATIDAVQADETVTVSGTTQSTSNTTGSIVTAGGVGIAKDVTIGGNVNVHGNLHANGNITSDGSLTFGDADTDNVVFGADVNSHIIPNTDDTYNLGSTTQQWGILYLGATQSTSNTTGSIVTAGGVGIKKNVTIGGSVNVHGNLHANGNITSDGDLTLGDAATDSVTFAADVNSHIIPNTDDTFDLGSTTQNWRDLHIAGNVNAVPVNTLATIGDVMALSIALG